MCSLLMTINHQPNCIFSFLSIYISGLDWSIHDPSWNLWFCFRLFPSGLPFLVPLFCGIEAWLFDTCAVSKSHSIGMMDHIWSCIHVCSISVNLNSFKRNWSKIRTFEKTIAPFSSKQLFWLHGEVFKPVKLHRSLSWMKSVNWNTNFDRD